MNEIDPIEVQFHLAHDCIRACVYADFIARQKPKETAWPSICDMLYSEAILAWNTLFGTNSQNSHWKKLAEKIPVPSSSKLKQFGKKMIVRHLDITEQEWDKYHASMVDIRNKRLAHFDPSVVRENMPNFTWAMHSACLYRQWLLSLLKEYKKAGYDIKVTDITGDEMLKMFKAQISEICK